MSSNMNVAIIGLSGRYSEAETPDILWNKLIKGEDLNTTVNNEHSTNSINHQNYVNRCTDVEDIDSFDHEFFNFSPYEAMITDPQQRIFLECCFKALEDAGYAQNSEKKCIGVFGSTSISTYFINNILHNKKYANSSMFNSILIGNDKDFLATHVSYKLNLSGPAITIQCACSSSLVALNYAYQSLLNYECDAALVGGVSITIPQNEGYIYQEGMIFSKDGYCRPFDDSSSGTVKGNGCSVILIKRLEDAQMENDHIYAVIKGTSVNNDASNKIGFTAPSVEGQADVISDCLSFAQVDPDQIDYIEAHGTGTRLGDPIEIRALSNVFKGVKKGIPVGSIKANVGHLDCAAGLTSLIKCIYILRNGVIPPNIYFKNLNSEISNSDNLFSFPNKFEQKIIENISISSFGIGGTNAHAVISAYHEKKRMPTELPCYILPISFLRKDDFNTIRKALIDALKCESCLQDFIFTMSVGKRRFSNNVYLVFHDKQELLSKLDSYTPDAIDGNMVKFPSFSLPELNELKNKIPLFRHYADKYSGKVTTEKRKFIYSRIAFIEFLDAIGAIDDSHVEIMDELDKALMKNRNENILNVLNDMGSEMSISNSVNNSDGRDIFDELFDYIGKVSLHKQIKFDMLYAHLNWGRISVPLYPLVKKRFWIEPDAETSQIPLMQSEATTVEKIQKNYTDQVIDIWEDILGIDNIQPDDDFYDVGGDSLLAISILCKINERFSQNFSLETLLNCTTPIDMSELIKNVTNKAVVPSFINKVRSAKNSRINLFLAHPAGGTTFCYRALNRYLNCDVTIYGLDLPENFHSFKTMEQLASFYLGEILKIQSDGEFFVGGYSFGGNLAYEIAHQLQKINKHVAYIMMFDSLPPDSYNPGNLTESAEYEKAFPNVITSYLSSNKKIGAISKLSFENNGVGEILKLVNAMDDTGFNIKEEDLSHFYDKWVYNHQLLKKYQPSKNVNADVLIFDGDQPNDTTISELLKVTFYDKKLWAGYLNGKLDIVPTEGNHFTMFSDNEYLNCLALKLNDIVTKWNENHKSI